MILTEGVSAVMRFDCLSAMFVLEIGIQKSAGLNDERVGTSHRH